MSSVAFRQSIRWLPDPPSEPTHTVVLTGPSGVFLDVRFLKDTPGEIDWAFAGYRKEVSENVVQFEHHIDSRTNDALSVVDIGTNSQIRPGVTLEVGKMVNPATGEMTPYEEIWEEFKVDLRELAGSAPPGVVRALFVRNAAGTVWRAQVAGWQLALGRDGVGDGDGDGDGRFWAWQAERRSERTGWEVVHSTGDKSAVRLLPDEAMSWKKGEEQTWDGDVWVVLDSER